MFSAKGTLIYDPVLGKDPVFSKWWVIVKTPDDIVEYYRSWFEKLYGIKLLKPKWGSHVSIVRGETPVDEMQWYWGYDNRREIHFEYSHDFYFNRDYVWLKVWGDDLMNIRYGLGLYYQPYFDFHITVGKFPKDIYPSFSSLHEVIRNYE